jgi:hypothetical protein
MSNAMRSLVFVQCTDALNSLTLNVWTGHLEDTMRDFRIDNHLEERREVMVRYFGSQTHRAAYGWIRDSVDVSPDETDKRKTSAATDAQVASMYNAADSSRALRNFLVGTAIYQECVMMARELRAIDVMDKSAVARSSVLAQKVEILFSPIYGRRRSAFEMAAWIVSEMRDRCQMCFEANSMLIESETIRFRGAGLSHIRQFTSTSLQREATRRIMINTLRREGNDLSMENTALQDPFDTNSMASASGTGIRPSTAISNAASVLFRQFKQRVLYGEEGVQRSSSSAGDYDYGDEAKSNRRKEEVRKHEEFAARGVAKTQRIVPFSEADVQMWESVVGAYDTRNYGNEFGGLCELEGKLHTFTSVAPAVWMPDGIEKMYARINTDIISDIATLAAPYYEASPAAQNKVKRRRRRR